MELIGTLDEVAQRNWPTSSHTLTDLQLCLFVSVAELSGEPSCVYILVLRKNWHQNRLRHAAQLITNLSSLQY